MYRLMTTVSLLVDDIVPGVATLQRAIGIPEPRPNSYRSGPGISAVFCRVHPKYAVAPTFLELVAPASPEQKSDELGRAGPVQATTAVFPARQVAERQSPRPVKWHATELALTDAEMADLAAHLEAQQVAIGWHPPDQRDRFYAAGHPASPAFDPAVDAGLFVEATKIAHLGLPEEALSAPADIPPNAQPDTMVRIVAREYLVADLDTALSALRRNLRWEPSSVTEEDGCRRAVMPFGAPRSARLELIQPRGPGRVADAYEQLGPGAWTVRVSVVDVEAKAKDLEARGTPFSFAAGVLRADARFTLQVPFEFVTALA
jgi:hypothetical protein